MNYIIPLLLCNILFRSDDNVRAESIEEEDHEHSRQRRNLIMPDPSEIQFIWGFGLPSAIVAQSITMGITMKFNFPLPSNSTLFTNPYANIQKRSALQTTRWELYNLLERISNRLDLDGRACVLRAICEAADTTLRYSGIVGEVLHVLLSPSTTDEAQENYRHREYHAAERLGREISGCCHVLYSECRVGLLDFISEVEGNEYNDDYS